MKSTGDKKTSNPTAKTGFAPRNQSAKSTHKRARVYGHTVVREIMVPQSSIHVVANVDVPFKSGKALINGSGDISSQDGSIAETQLLGS